jgi:hypothetical protein
MRLHVLYRSYGGENQKGRPSYYSKRLSLLSFLRSVEGAPDIDVTFINNGPIPADRLELMQATGAPILQIDKPAMRPSYRFALNHAMKSDWADEDVVYLCEDDYLHIPDALARLDQAIRALPEISYFLTYGSTQTHPVRSVEHLEHNKPRGWRPGVSAEVDGQTWRPTLGATSTYAARLGALRQDYGIILQGHLPYRHHYLDLEMGLVWQGYEPYRWGNIAREAVGLAEGGAREKIRAVGGAPFKVAFNLRAHRRPDRRRLLYVAEPNLATHVEAGWTSPGHDWAALAEETQRWFDARPGERDDRVAEPEATARSAAP